MTVLILTISCLKFRLATHLKWVKGILVALCVMCVEKPLVQRRTLLHIFSQHAMVRRALIVISDCQTILLKTSTVTFRAKIY